ncbi:tetraprenyl-beta-curcumene synthase family protein [Conexibacter woesei]|uniref:tetraprenyl-beta-curcumene synthase family protein n=1 Tax=Conexibacter woesei TaxID=191495 RepID=UPI00135F1985|nr:tetraprenyl-beta-curcumene synthase family protein [Conexibacter woesei]
MSREVQRWRTRADAIPDAALRSAALDALDHKRGHTDGAALFWTLPVQRHPRLLQLLVAYELIWDFLDNLSEQRATVDPTDDRQLFLAIADALDPARPISDYYLHHPSRDDGGYLVALVNACREHCRALPAFETVRPLLAKEGMRASVLGINHDPDPERRDAALRAWVAREFPGEHELCWYELTAAASTSLMTHALLALAAEPGITTEDAEATYAAYFPWLGLAGTMLDSYVDEADDLQAGAHSYIAHYPDRELATSRLCESIDRSARDVLALPHGERHAVLLSCMIALYLSKDSARVTALQPTTRQIARAGGSLPKLLLPVLRIWRLCNSQSSAT